MSIVKDTSLAEYGRMKIAWVRDFMPALGAIRERMERERPFAGMKITMSIHMEAKTAYLATCLQAAGAEVHATGCNPLSTQDDVAAGLASLGVETYAIHGVSEAEYQELLVAALSCHPDLIIDDGGDLVNLLTGDYSHLADRLIGGAAWRSLSRAASPHSWRWRCGVPRLCARLCRRPNGQTPSFRSCRRVSVPLTWRSFVPCRA